MPGRWRLRVKALCPALMWRGGLVSEGDRLQAVGTALVR